MKFLIFLPVIILGLLTSPAIAQVTHYDSLTVNYHISDAGIDNAKFVDGPPDGLQVRLQGGTQLLVIGFVAGGSPVTFQKGATIHLYWNRKTADSNAADIQFLTWTDGPPRQGPTLKLVENYPVNVEQMFSLTVPDTGFNSLGITVAADTGANSFYLDAISLMQAGEAGVFESNRAQPILLTGYPNPFIHSSSIRFDAPMAGRAAVLITDALGRAVEQQPLGEVGAGEQDVRIALDHPGVYFARLIINGAFMGQPLKLTAE